MKKLKHMKLLMLLMVGFMAVLIGFKSADAAPSGKGVGTLSELEMAIANGESEIYLTADIDVPGYINIEGGKKIRLDLNGHSLKLNSNDTGRSNIKVDGSELTICDSSEDQEGRIYNGRIFGSGGAICVKNKGTLNLESGIISNSMARWGGAVAVTGGSTFNMKGGIIEKNLINANGFGLGGGVCVEDGTFNMTGGVIRGNQEFEARKNNGGGVAVAEKGVFNMTGGRVGDFEVVNSANSISGLGAGVYVAGGTFKLEGGKVVGNVTSSCGGGIYIDEGSTFKMSSGAEIYYNMSTGNGGGVYIKNADCEISGGSIYKNTSTGGGFGGGIYIDEAQTKTIMIANAVIEENLCGGSAGGIYIGNGGLGLQNVTVKNNIANTENGGGIYVDNEAILAVYKGSFTGNTAENGAKASKGFGGAIYMGGESKATVSGAEFSDNIANDGGAIYVDINAGCGLVDDTITDNSAYSYRADSVFVAGGVTVKGSLKVGGALVVKDNTHNSSDGSEVVRGGNVLLDADSCIELAAPLLDGAQIGVWKESADGTRKITSNYGTESYSTWRYRPDRYFFSDDATYFVQKDPALQTDAAEFHEAFLMKPKHEHKLVASQGTNGTCIAEGKSEYYSCEDCYHIFADEKGEYEIKESEINTSRDVKNHVGTTTEKVVDEKPATCTTSGRRTIKVTCDTCGRVIRVYNEVVDALGHEMVAIDSLNGVQGTGAKCTREGCDYYWFIPATDYHCEHKELDKHEKIDPTCTESGMKAYAVCKDKDCGRYFAYDENTGEYSAEPVEVEKTAAFVEDLYISPTGHKIETEEIEGGDRLAKWFVDEENSTPATCTVDGLIEEYTRCEVCHAVLERRQTVEAAHGHKFGEAYVENCQLMKKCKVCGLVVTLGPNHNLLEVERKEPGCLTEGHKDLYICLTCGKLFDYDSFKGDGTQTQIDYSEVVIDPLGHDFGEWQLIEEPTAAEKGTEICYCSRCEAFETRDVDYNITYKFIKGENLKWTLGGTGTALFKIERSYKDGETFEKWFSGKVYIDGKELSADAFTAKDGCVEIEIKASAMNALEVGKHVITVGFEDAEASAELEVVEAEEKITESDKDQEAKVDTNTDTGSPKTGDETPVALLIALAGVSVAAIVVCVILKIKKGKKKDSQDDESEE